MLRKALALACFAAVLANSADAATVTRPRDTEKLVLPDNLYAVEVSCKQGIPLEDANSLGAGRNRSLFLLITKTVPLKGPDGTSPLPTDTLAAMQLYSIGKDQTTKQPVIFDGRDCRKSFLLNGSKGLVLVLTENRMDNFSDSGFGKVVAAALSLVSPVFGLMTGAALPVAAASTIANIGAINTAIPNLLNALSQGKNYTQAIQDLRVGKYTIKTEYVTITVVIRPIVSIVTDENPQYRSDLRAQVEGAQVKLDGEATKIGQSCRAARHDISQLGFKWPTDIAYGVMNLSAHAGFNRAQSMDCLTKEFATPAAEADERFWGNFLPEFKLTVEMVKEHFPPPETQQPAFDTATKRKIDELVIAMARYFRNDPPPKDSIDTLSRLLAPDLLVADRTTTSAMGTDGSSKERFAALQPFKEKGYIRVGCYAATSAATDQDLDEATSMFLVFKAPNEVTRTTIDQALAVRPKFGPSAGPIAELGVSDNRKWITAVLSDRGYDCNGFSVERPAVPKAQ